MGVKYVKDFSFHSSGGFHGDVQRYAKGGHVTKMPAKAKASAKDMPARAKPNAPAKGAPKMASKPAVGKRQGYDKGGRVPGREMDRLPTKRPPGRGKDLAPARPFKGKYEGYAEGGPVAEILPGDGRGKLDAVPMPPMKPMDDDGGRNDFLYQMLQRDTERMRGDAAQQMRDISALEAAPPVQLGGEIPVGALTPIPEEPYGRRSSGPPPPPGMKVNPNYGKPGQDYYVFIDGVPSASAPRMERPEPIGLLKPAKAGTRGPATAARRAALEKVMGMRQDMGRRPAAAPAPKASRNALLRALASRMKAPAPVSRVRSEVLPVNPAAIPAFKKGGEVSGKKIAKVMREYKAGKLHSGSKKGPKVTSEKQAMAIALSEARKAGAKIPKKAMGGEIDYAKAPNLKGIFNDENMAYESKGPKTRYSAARSRRESKERAMERRALDKARHAEKYAPGMSLDMPDKKSKGGMPVHRRKPMYGGGKC